MHPELFSFGPLAVHSYGVMVAIGILMASWYITRRAHLIGVSKDDVLDLIFTTCIAGFIGARLLYIIYEFEYFKMRPLEVFAIWHGGIIFYGGMIGGFIGFAIQVRRKKISFWRTLDMFVPGIALAQGFGRIGCFLNGCCFGRETKLPIGVVFPFSSVPLHPTQLYDAIFCFALSAFLTTYYSKHSKEKGNTALLYFMLQPIGRFTIEFFRGDMAKLAFGLTLGQWMSMGIFAASASAYVILHSKKSK